MAGPPPMPPGMAGPPPMPPGMAGPPPMPPGGLPFYTVTGNYSAPVTSGSDGAVAGQGAPVGSGAPPRHAAPSTGAGAPPPLPVAPWDAGDDGSSFFDAIGEGGPPSGGAWGQGAPRASQGGAVAGGPPPLPVPALRGPPPMPQLAGPR